MQREAREEGALLDRIERGWNAVRAGGDSPHLLAVRLAGNPEPRATWSKSA